MALEKLYTTAEAAEVLGVSVRTIFRYMKDSEPKLKAQKIGKAWKIKESDLQAFINNSEGN